MYNFRILYVEDDPIALENMALILKGMFSEVYLAQNGKAALELYRKKQPDIILIDNYMPIINGFEVIRQIRKNDPDTPIVVLTAHDEKEELKQAIPLKLEEYLVKPVNIQKLTTLLESIISRLSVHQDIQLTDFLKWDSTRESLVFENKLLKLTKKEKQAVTFLIDHLNRYVSSDALIYHIWEDEIPDESHNNKLIQLIYRINKKVAAETNRPYKLIENSYALGYRITNE